MLRDVLTAIKESELLHEIIYMILVAGNFLNTVSITNSYHVHEVSDNIFAFEFTRHG